MSTLPSRRISRAIAWLLLAIAVAGGVRIVGRSGDAGPPDPAPQARASKTIHREATPIGKESPSPREAIEALIARKPCVERDQALGQAVGTWAEETPEEALSWVRHLKPGEDRDWLLVAALTSLADRDASQAAALLEAEMPPGLPRNHALVAIAQRWVQIAPDDARAWLDSLEDSPGRDEGLREIGIIRVALFPHSAD